MNNFELLLKDMTYNTKFTFLEEGKNKKELISIGEKRGLKLPSNDLAVFKCVYAFVDRMNLNKCTLPKEEVEKSLDSLIGKAIDFDHLRKRVVGYWIDAKLEKDKIIAYGVFFKSNFQEDYQTIKDLLESDVLAISFEAWGDKQYTGEEGQFDLTNIEFAGGALLIKTEPAFPGSEVMEMAKSKDGARVLEFAQVMKAPKEYIHLGESYSCECIDCGYKTTSNSHCKDLKCPKCGAQMRRSERPGPGQGNEDKSMEISRFYLHDIEMMSRLLFEVDCLSCKEKGMFDITEINFLRNTASVKCVNCESFMKIDFTPSARIAVKGRKIKKVTALEESHIDFYEGYFESFEGTDEELDKILMNEIESIETSKALKYKERKNLSDDKFAVVKTVKNKKTGKERKIRMFPIHDESHVRNALSRLAQKKTQDTLRKLGISVDSVKRKILRRAKELNMKNLLEKYKKATVDEVVQTIASATIKRELTEDELEKALEALNLQDLKGKSIANETSLNNDDAKKTSQAPSLQSAEVKEEDIVDVIKNLVKADEEKKEDEDKKKDEGKVDANKDDNKAKATVGEKANKDKQEAKVDKDEEVESLKKELAEAKAKLAEIAKKETEAKLNSRREELGEFAKDMKDEDLLDDVKFENAKLKKTLEEIKSGKVDIEKVNVDLTKGSNDKKGSDELAIKRKSIQELAFGSQDS